MPITQCAARRRDRARACLGFTVAAAIVVATGGQARAGEDTRYKYDAQGQVILKSRSSGQQNGYAYDQAGNRLNLVGGVQVPPTYPDRLLEGQSLLPGKSLSSANGLYSLILQDDGNLVLYGQNGLMRWQSGVSSGKPAARLTMQSDGNLVIYGPVSQVYWATGTSGGPGSALVLQDDGNLVVYSSGGAALWHIYQ